MVNQHLPREPRIRSGGKQSLHQMMLGKLDIRTQKNEAGPLSDSSHKNELEMDEGLKGKT